MCACSLSRCACRVLPFLYGSICPNPTLSSKEKCVNKLKGAKSMESTSLSSFQITICYEMYLVNTFWF
jgi:hypothetical protein